MASRTSTDPIEILLEMGVDLDNLSEEEDYLSALMEAVNTLTIINAKDPRISPLQQEIVKVRKKRKAADTRFKARKTKISAGTFKKGSATGTNLKPKALPTSALVLYQAPEAATEEEGGEKKKRKRKPKEKNLLKEIAKSVTNIADTLKKQYNLKKKFTEEERRRAEQQKRKLQEAGLEKRFEGILKTAQKIIAPIRSIFDRIIQFLTMVFLGKFLSKLVDWFTNPENQSKVKSIIRFLSDNWPKLLSAYIIFGTGLGKFSRFLVKVLARGAVRLAAATTGLLARLFGARALGRFSRFFGRKGQLIAGGIEAVTTIFAFKALEDAFTKNLAPAESASIDNDIPISGYQGGGLVQPIFKFGGGGRVNLNLISSNGILGYEEGGEVDGPTGIDKVPAMLTDGEFVMSRGAVQKYGLSQLEAMNAAGGGTNKPKMMNGTVFAAGGGHVGDRESAPDKMLTPASNFGYRLGQVNPMQDLRVMGKVVEKVVDKERRRGQGGRLLGSTTQRAGEGTKIYKDGHLVTSYDKYGRKKEYGKPEGFMRALAGLGDLLTGNLFDFDRRNERNVGISKSRIVTKDFKGSRDYTDDTTTSKVMSAIGRPDLIEHQDQILKQLPKGTTIQDVIKGDVPGVTPYQLTKILATSDAQEATRIKQDRARRLDLAIRGIGEKDGVSMMAGDMTPALRQAEATANKRHAELMRSTDQKKIAAYDKKHGQGAYSHKLKEKLYRTYGAGASGQTKPAAPTPTGQVVGRENLPSATQKVLARMDAQRAGTLPPDVKTSGPLLGRMAMDMMGGLNNIMSGLTGGITGAINNPKSFVESMGGTVVDSNSQEQNMKRVMALSPEMKNAVLADMERSQSPQAKLSSNQPRPKISAPQPPTPPSNNVKVIKSPTKKQTRATESGSTGGSNTPNINAGNGDSSKFKIYGFSPPR